MLALKVVAFEMGDALSSHDYDERNAGEVRVRVMHEPVWWFPSFISSVLSPRDLFEGRLFIAPKRKSSRELSRVSIMEM